MTLFIPFSRSPINALRNVVEYSPAGFLSTRLQKMFKAGGDERTEAIARVLAGTAMYGTAFSIVNSTDIVGREIPPQYAGEQGLRPNSIRLGDSWYSFDRLGHQSAILGIMADMKNLGSLGESTAEDLEDDATAMHYMSMLIGHTAGTSPITPFEDVLAILSGEDKTMSKAKSLLVDKTTMALTPLSGAQRFLGDVIEPDRPQIFTAEERAISTEIDDETEAIYARLMNRWRNQPVNRELGLAVGETLGLEGRFVDQVDTLGLQMSKNDNSLLGRSLFYLGFNNSLSQDDPVVLEMQELGVVPTSYTGKLDSIKGIELNLEDSQNYRSNKYRGEHGVLTYMRSMLSNPKSGYWQSSTTGVATTPEERRKMWEQVLSNSERYAEGVVLKEDPKLAQEDYQKTLKMLEVQRTEKAGLSKDEFQDYLNQLEGK